MRFIRLFLSTLLFTSALAAASGENIIDIPKASVAVSNPAWAKTAYHADVLKPLGDKDPAHAALALAWNEEGLLIHIAADDATPVQARDLVTLWSGAGGAAPEIAPRLAKIPIWAFHGDADPVVPIGKDQRIVDALKELNAPIKFTVYPGVDHDSWTRTYDNPELYDWLLKQSRQ